MRTVLVSTIIFLSVFSCFSQDLSEKYAKYIDTVDLRRHLTVLASDEYEGRETGTKGQKKAAKYIKGQFKKMNCSKVPESKYYQEFKLLKKIKTGKIEVNGQILNYPQDFGFNGLYQTLNFELNTRRPRYTEGKYLLASKEDFSEELLIVEIEDYKLFNFEQVSKINCLGIVFVIKNYEQRFFTDYTTDNLSMLQENPKAPYLFLNKNILRETFYYHEDYCFWSFNLEARLNPKPKYIKTSNVIGFVEGTDSELKNEIIVISAHHDHIGTENGKIFNGADDNGSGTSGLLEIAEAFQRAKKEGKNPKRSILFLSVTGEEMGLFGSAYYANNPLFPLENTIADLNIDMIGRTTKESEKDTFSVYVIGSNMLSNDLHNTQELANQKYTHLDLDYKYNDVNDPLKLYYRSDHYNFAKNGIPSIFYFGGFHDDYHKETDEIDKINFEKIRQISIMVFHTAWMLGNAESKPRLN